MNEQHIDALPPVQASPVDGQNPAPAQPGATPSVQPIPPMPAGPMPGGPIPGASTPPIADDIDLIEKEWVEKAKQIVEQTKHDPFQQNEAMTSVKADYLKKRYGRDIKMGDS